MAVVGIAMMAASGTETSLAGNYRSSSASYYAALSGLEEARYRLILKNPPNPLGLTGYLPMSLGHALYITNPSPSDASGVDPTSGAYQDTEYFKEFGSSPTVQTVSSTPTLAGSQNALYKWVRINALTERALKIDVNNTSGNNSSWNNAQIVRFDGTNLTRSAAPFQALEITALAVLPDGSRKLLQYVVAPIPLQIPVTAALTFTSGNAAVDAVSFTPPAGTPPPPGTTNFYVNGNDQCSTNLPLPAIGVANSYDWTSINNTIGSPPASSYAHSGHFVGSTPTPSFSNVTPSNAVVDLTDAISLSNYLPTIKNAADTVLNGPRTEADMPAAMSSTNFMTVYVDGDLSLTSFTNGWGLLVVRGNLTYTGDTVWRGIVVVLGGTMEEVGSADGGEFDGAVIVTHLDPGGLAKPTFTVGNPGGGGIHYNSCWVNAAQKPYTYKVLAFHEIPLS